MYDVPALLRRQSAHAIQELVVAGTVIEAHVRPASGTVLTRNSSSRWGPQSAAARLERCYFFYQCWWLLPASRRICQTKASLDLAKCLSLRAKEPGKLRRRRRSAGRRRLTRQCK